MQCRYYVSVHKLYVCVCMHVHLMIDYVVDVIDAAGEMLSVAGPFLEQQMHPTVIIGAFRQALDDLLTILKDQVSIAVDITNRDEMTRIIKSCIGTKFITKWLEHIFFCIFVCMVNRLAPACALCLYIFTVNMMYFC